MQYTHYTNKAQSYYDMALEKLQELGLAPLPEFYELWFVYFSGDNPGLCHAVEMMELEGKDFDFEACSVLYNKYLDSESENEQVREAGSQIQITIKDVNELVSDVHNATAKYNDKLTEVSTKLGSSDYSQDEMKILLNDVAQDTQTILGKNKNLEDQLNRQAVAMMALTKDLQRVTQEAMTDALTNVSNRKAFEEQIAELIQAVEAEEIPSFSLVLMDIDHFKVFNDDYGHQVGDQVLRLVAKTLLDGVKGRDFVARYGGEEFAILLPETNQHAGLSVANVLREAVAAKEIVNRNTGKKMGRITLSGGLTEYYAGDSRDDLVERADNALYLSKDKGRNQISLAKIEVVRGQ